MIVLHACWRRIMVVIVVLGIAASAAVGMPDRNALRDELINRPIGPLACLPAHFECELRW